MKMKLSYKAKVLTFAYAIAIPTAVVAIGFMLDWW